MKDVSSIVLQQSLRDLDVAYQNFFRGKKVGKHVGFPKYRSKSCSQQSFRVAGQNSFRVQKLNKKWGLLVLLKKLSVKFRFSRELPSNPNSVTVTKKSDGCFEISFVVNTPTPNIVTADTWVGVDVGVIDTATIVCSNGTRQKIGNPKILAKHQNKLVKAQQALSKKKKGSKNRYKQRHKVAKLHSVVKRSRVDFLHKLSSMLVHKNHGISIEDLDVKTLMKTKNFTEKQTVFKRSLQDTGLGLLLSLIKSKASEYGRELKIANRYYPSSRICCVCENVGAKKPLNVRVWQCVTCQTFLDRYYNAATNLLMLGLSMCGEDIRRKLAVADIRKLQRNTNP